MTPRIGWSSYESALQPELYRASNTINKARTLVVKQFFVNLKFIDPFHGNGCPLLLFLYKLFVVIGK
jgi:hypothetical protein